MVSSPILGSKNNIQLEKCLRVFIGYFKVGERVRFLFTSCVNEFATCKMFRRIYRLLHGWWAGTVFYSQRVNKNRTSELTVKQLIYYIHAEIHRRTELTDKHIFIFFQKKTRRGQAASQWELHWNGFVVKYFTFTLSSKNAVKGRTS